MNSYDKFMEKQENNNGTPVVVVDMKVLHRAKIHHVIRGYELRVFSCQEEIKVLEQCIALGSEEYYEVYSWKSRISVLQQEVEFCERQKVAYKNNDERRKIIPDRLLL